MAGIKGKYRGPMKTDDLFQAMLQDRNLFFQKYGISHILEATLYCKACNEHGEMVVVKDPTGAIVKGFNGAGAYHCAADQYDLPSDIEPKTVTQKTTPPNGNGNPTGAAAIPFGPI